MRNRKLARPFEFLVRFLDLPRSGSLDPTMLMALFLPLMVGVMVGDIVYGTLLLVIALVVRRRFAGDSAAVRDLSRVFVAGALWAIVFGVLFGEALGDVGHKLGLPALWFYRGGADAVEPLLLFALALGVVHVVLGQVLGLWQSASARRRVELRQPLRVAARARRRPRACRCRRATAYRAGCARRSLAGGGRGGRPRAPDRGSRRARLRHGAARADRHARQRPLLPAPRRRRPRLDVPGDGRERAGRPRPDLAGRLRRDVLPRAEPRRSPRSAR